MNNSGKSSEDVRKRKLFLDTIAEFDNEYDDARPVYDEYSDTWYMVAHVIPTEEEEEGDHYEGWIYEHDNTDSIITLGLDESDEMSYNEDEEMIMTLEREEEVIPVLEDAIIIDEEEEEDSSSDPEDDEKWTALLSQWRHDETDILYYWHPFGQYLVARHSNWINRHYNDAYVVFVGGIENPLEHYYAIDGDKTGVISVTGVIHEGFEPFDPDKMSRICSANAGPSSIYYNKSIQDCLDMWDENRDTGSAKHASIDDYLQGRPQRPIQTGKSKIVDGPPLGFFEFLKAYPDLVPYRTEWSLFSRRHLLSGQMDAIFWDKRREIFVGVDWKNVRNFKTSSYTMGKIPATADYQDCHLGHYTVQLNLYRELLERYYGIVLGEMMVVNFPADAEYMFQPYVIEKRNMQPFFDMLPLTEEGRQRIARSVS